MSTAWQRTALYAQLVSELAEMKDCAERDCTQPATPSGPRYFFGYVDSDMNKPFFLRKWRCPAGHFYTMEANGPDEAYA